MMAIEERSALKLHWILWQRMHLWLKVKMNHRSQYLAHIHPAMNMHMWSTRQIWKNQHPALLSLAWAGVVC